MTNVKDLLNKYSNGVSKFEYDNEKEREYIKLVNWIHQKPTLSKHYSLTQKVNMVTKV